MMKKEIIHRRHTTFPFFPCAELRLLAVCARFSSSSSLLASYADDKISRFDFLMIYSSSLDIALFSPFAISPLRSVLSLFSGQHRKK